MSLWNKLPLFLLPLTAVHAQKAKDEKSAELTAPTVSLVGVWSGKTPRGGEYATFTGDGRVILKSGPSAPMSLNYKLDASATPWKLDLSGNINATPVSLYTVVEFPAPGQFRMARPAIDPAKRPGPAALKTAPVLQRVTLAAHGGIYQVVEAALKKLSGSWEGQDGGQPLILTFSPDGTWAMKVAGAADRGRYRLDVSKLPFAVDLLSTEGSGMKYSILEIKEDVLRTGKAGNTPEDRPQAFDEISSKTFRKKPAGGAK